MATAKRSSTEAVKKEPPAEPIQDLRDGLERVD